MQPPPLDSRLLKALEQVDVLKRQLTSEKHRSAILRQMLDKERATRTADAAKVKLTAP